MSLPRNQIESHLANCKPAVVDKGLSLLSEVLTITELEAEVITANVQKLKFYYGTEKNDGWTNDNNYRHLLEKVPNANAEVDNQNILHCFQLRSGLEMGQITAEWIAKNRA